MIRRVGNVTLSKSIVGWVNREAGVAFKKKGSQWCVSGLRGQRSAHQGTCYRTLKAAVQHNR